MNSACYNTKNSSWERRLAENTNGVILQYFPKEMDFAKLTQEDANRVVDKLNN